MKINSHLTTRRFRPLLPLLAGAMGLLASCVVSEEDRMMRKDAPTNEIQMNFVVSRAGLQQIDGVRMTPNILLMTQQQAADFDNLPADYLSTDDAYTHLVEVLGKINDYYKMTYNTGVEYASNGDTYVARGYAPAVVLAPRETDRGARRCRAASCPWDGWTSSLSMPTRLTGETRRTSSDRKGTASTSAT